MSMKLKVGVGLFAALAVLLGGRLALAAATRASAYSWFDPLVDVYTAVSRNYVEEPDRDRMLNEAIAGMLESLGDPYSEFIPAEAIAEFDKQTRGQYVGIGASVQTEDGVLLIVSPLEDSPAYRAGLQAGDRVVAIDGESNFGLTVYENIDLLTGEPGTEVTLTIERGEERFDVTLERQRIVTRTVKGVHRKAGGESAEWDYWIDPESRIAYIRLTQFQESSGREVREALEALTEAGLSGLIFDLRFNSGGAVNAAIEISDMFLDSGVIFSTRGRAHEEQVVRARRGDTLGDFPVIVLVNRQSASASEIVAGALKENDRAVALGERSFGKGLVQAVKPLPSGAGLLKLTEQHYYLPNGRNIHRTEDSTVWGVDPSEGFYVPMTDDEYVAMLEVRREEEIIRDRSDETGRWSDPAWILERLKDEQLARAVEAMRARIETGRWEAVGSENVAETVSLAELNRARLFRERILRQLDRVEEQILALEGVTDISPMDDRDLLPDDVELTGGMVTVTDAQGREVGRLRITGETLERWLVDAPVEREAAGAGAP